MSDTRYEQLTNTEVVRRAHGDVLIAGLGIGMILTRILDKPEVESVTVIEKYQDVIDLVEPHYRNPKLTVICADIYDWKPAKGTVFNCIYFDIWADQSTDCLVDMAKLHQRFKFFLDKRDDKRWMDSWNRDELKYNKRHRGW